MLEKCLVMTGEGQISSPQLRTYLSDFEYHSVMSIHISESVLVLIDMPQIHFSRGNCN